MPFTIVMGMATLGLAVFTGSAFRPIHADTLAVAGLAASHIDALELHRVLTSALLTHGGMVFWRSWAVMLLVLAWSESTNGTRLTAAAFWAGHTLVVVALALIAGPMLRLASPSIAEVVFVATDVGPSAGYFSCLGLSVAAIGVGGRRRSIAGALLVGLFAVVAWRSSQLPVNAAAWLADAAHLLAFAGAFAARNLWAPRPPGPDRCS